MGINPDAYMSGAIPGLSRGGSWQNVQDPYPSPHDQTQQGGESIYPRPSQIVPPGSARSTMPGMGNRSHSHFAHHHHHQNQHPWAMTALPQSPLSNGFAPSYQQSYFGVGSQGSSTGYSPSGKAPSVGPTRHPGWTNLNGQYIGVHTAPSSPTVKHSQTPPRSTTSKHPPSISSYRPITVSLERRRTFDTTAIRMGMGIRLAQTNDCRSRLLWSISNSE
jgi:hypothetical protein